MDGIRRGGYLGGLLLGMAAAATLSACVNPLTYGTVPHSGSCWVYDTDIDQYYNGGCIDGVVPERGNVKLAHGWGIAMGRDEYTGNFQNGKKHGTGVYAWGPRSSSYGTRFEGEFADDRMVRGVTTSLNGARREVEYTGDGAAKGVMTWPGGIRYEGEFKGASRHGYGTLSVPRGKYDAASRSKLGFWQGDTFIEQGLFEDDHLVTALIVDQKTGCKVVNPVPKSNESVSWSGGCRDGFADGKGVLTWFGGGAMTSREEGLWQAGKRTDGAGTISRTGDYTYSGTFKDGTRHGKGTMTWVGRGPGGLKKYTGQFVSGEIYGEGVGEFADGDRYAGRWANGAPVGETQRNASTPKERERIVSALAVAIADDATHWSFNKYDYGSVRFDKVTSRHPNRAIAVARVNYTYNRGRDGWVEAKFYPGGGLDCVVFHDFPHTCRSTRTSRADIAANRTGDFTPFPNSPEHEKNQIRWGASCTEGGYAWVAKRYDETTYSWGSGGFTGSTAGADYQLTVEQMLRKACKGG